MTIQDAFQKGTRILKDSNIETPVVEAGVILCHVLGCDRSYLYTHGGDNLDELKYEDYLSKVASRAKGLPVQYITGRQEFMSLEFHVTPDVLIPRHDTEVLVEAVIEHVKSMKGTKGGDSENNTDEVRILDIGTGSGCIAISLAFNLDNCLVTALDISQAALKVAQANAVKLGVGSKVKFVNCDIMNDMGILPAEEGLFDIIVSNPPYIPHSHIKGLQTEVREFEPVTALDGGQDGLDFYRKIASNSGKLLKQGGVLAFEVGYDQAVSVRTIMDKDFYDIALLKDISGIDRVVIGFLK